MRCPDRGDILWTNFDPQVGHEQAGSRPALVLSPRNYNTKLGLAIVCPITSQQKSYVFSVPLPGGLKTRGNVLANQITTVDWNVRGVKIAERAPEAVLSEVVALVDSIIDPE